MRYSGKGKKISRSVELSIGDRSERKGMERQKGHFNDRIIWTKHMHQTCFQQSCLIGRTIFSDPSASNSGEHLTHRVSWVPNG